MKRKVQSGFTLIELMIVVAIIGVLAAIALPAYQTYMIKSKLVEATTDLDAAKVVIAESYGTNSNVFPLTAASPIGSVGANAKYVSALTYNGTANGPVSIVATLAQTGNTNIDGKFMGLIGTAALDAGGNKDGTVKWTCATMTGTGSVAAGVQTAMYPYLPSNCQN